jgi:hypothetical protein
MNNINKSILILLSLITIGNFINAQRNNIYQAADAVMLHANENNTIQYSLKGVVLILSNSNELNVRFSIPYPSITNKPADNTMLLTSGLPFNLKLHLDQWQILDYLTSSKTFFTDGMLTLNDCTRRVKVEYMPLPAVYDLDGNFNLSMIIQFNPADFNLDEQHSNSRITVTISDVPVNRI